MKIIVASAFPADSNYANAINTIKIADGFAKNGHHVMIVCRQSKNIRLSNENLREQYHLSDRVAFYQTPSKILFIPLSAHEAFAKQVIKIAVKYKPDFAYCRNFIAPIKLAEQGVPTVAESHAHVGNNTRPLLEMVRSFKDNRQLRGLVTIGETLRNNFVNLGVPKNKVKVLPDAVDLELFTPPSNFKRSSRPKPLITYSGHFYDYKGIPTVLNAAAKTPEWDYQLVGGHKKDIERIKSYCNSKVIKNVFLTGFLPHSEVPNYLWDSDVLILPPSEEHPSANWTSPVKLGEYLASGSPIVATAIPALRHWLKKNEVYFVKPDNSDELIKGIKQVLKNQSATLRMTKRAYRLAEKISYQKRCARILNIAGF